MGDVTEEAVAQEERDHYTQLYHDNGKFLLVDLKRTGMNI